MKAMELREALALRNHDVVAFVGGGGKTTSMYRLCREASAAGLRAVASGTARFTLPTDRMSVPILIEADEAKLSAVVRAHLSAPGWVVAARDPGSKGRLQPLSEPAVDALARAPDVDLVVLEADGSAMRSFKAPADHEPAVPRAATLVVSVVGADVFGRPLNESLVHRPERVSALTGAQIGSEVTPELVASVLSDPEGGRKRIPPGARYAVLINKVNPERLPIARQTAKLLIAAGVERVVLARAQEEPPVIEVLTSGS